MMRSLMSNSVLDEQGWIKSDNVIKQLDRAAESGWAPNQLWYLLVLELWLRKEKEQKTCADNSRALIDLPIAARREQKVVLGSL
jgi:hypothetical protein